MRRTLTAGAADILTGLAALALFILGDNCLHMRGPARCGYSPCTSVPMCGACSREEPSRERVAERATGQHGGLCRTARFGMGLAAPCRPRTALVDCKCVRGVWRERPPLLGGAVRFERRHHGFCLSGRTRGAGGDCHSYACDANCHPQDERSRSRVFSTCGASPHSQNEPARSHILHWQTRRYSGRLLRVSRARRRPCFLGDLVSPLPEGTAGIGQGL